MTQTVTEAVEIREAVPGDVPALRDLWVEFMDFHLALDPDYKRNDDAVDRWEAYIRSKFEDAGAAVLVAIEARTFIGYIGAKVRPYPPVFVRQQYGYIEEIAVASDHRRRGVARRMYSAAESWLLAQGIDRIRVTIDVANDFSGGFFRQMGFSEDTETLTKKF